MFSNRKNQSAFTIVELLIVIVVIAILAAVTVVAYNGIQKRAQDARSRVGMDRIEKAIKLYAQDYGQVLSGGSGATATATVVNGVCVDSATQTKTGYGSGFIGTGLYSCTVEDILVATRALPAGFIKGLPVNTYFHNSLDEGGIRGVMVYDCNPTPAKYVILSTLSSPTPEDDTAIEKARTECGLPTNINGKNSASSDWGMRTARVIYI